MVDFLVPSADQLCRVANDEHLLRSVLARLEHTRGEGGRLRLAWNTFDDDGQEVSVDRSALRIRIVDAKKQLDAGVARIVAEKVRGVTSAAGKKGEIVVQTDVRPDPLRDSDPGGPNPSHALIYPRSSLSGNQFKKLCKAIALFCHVEIEPIDPTGRNYSAGSIPT